MNSRDAMHTTHDAQRFGAVLFDLDGTLLNTLTDLADAMNTSLVHFGFAPHPVDAYRYFIGDAVETEARRALPESARDARTIKKVAEYSEQIYDKCWHKNTKPYPGIPELLSAIEKKTLPMVVLSNKPDHFTKVMVASLLSDFHFKIVQGALPDVPVKPEPEAALQIAKRLGISPEHLLYLGDTNTDMRTAVNAGMFPVGVLWGFRDADELLKNGAKALAGHPADVNRILCNPAL